MNNFIVILVSITLTKAHFFENKPFNSNPGIYFENISPLNIAISQWNLLTFYNSSSYEQNYAFIDIYFNKCKQICNLFQNKSEEINEICVNFKSINSQLLNKINEERDTLQQYLKIDRKNIGTQSIRQKRSSYFGGIGMLQRTLFGVLTEEEGEEYQSKIKVLEEKQVKNLLIQKEQIKIFESTLDSVTKIASDFTTIKNNLNNYIIKIKNGMLEQKEELKIMKIKENILLYNTMYSELVNQYSKETSALLNTITSAHRGQLNPQILKPNELLEQLRDIKANLPTNLNLPIEINFQNYFDLMKIIELNILYTNHLIIYSINIPLIENLDFQLYHIISLPVYINNNNFIFIQSTQDYLIVEKNKQYYSLMTQDQINKCINIKPGIICDSNIPLAKSNKPNCEFQMFLTQSNISNECEVKSVTIFKDIWLQLKNSNSWLYATHIPLEVVISCQETVENTIINKTGLLTLKPNCKAFTKNTIILSKFQNKSNFSKDYLPSFHLPDYTESINNKIKKQNIQLDNSEEIRSPQRFNELKLHAKSLAALNKEIDNELISNNRQNITTTHSIGITVITIIIVGIILTKLIKWINNINRQETNNKTTDKLNVVYHIEKNKKQTDDIITIEENK